MSKLLFSASALLVLVSACATSHSENNAVSVAPSQTPSSVSWLDPASLHYSEILPGPPALHSKESNQDFKELEKLQKTRTEAECIRAEEEVHFDNFIHFFQSPRGPLTEQQVTALAPFADDLSKTARPIWWEAKQTWKRPRPFLTDKKLHPCVHLEKSSAYPSGHAASGELYAKVLSDLFPAQKDALLKRGQEIGQDRLIGGVHHPSDVRDGRVLADHVYDELQKSPAYLSAVEKAKKAIQ